MGFLDLFKSRAETPPPLPSGSFTVDRTGTVLSSTVSSSFPAARLKEISALVLKTFREGQKQDLSFAEFTVHFGAFTIKARELRGGAMVFLSPRGNPRK